MRAKSRDSSWQKNGPDVGVDSIVDGSPPDPQQFCWASHGGGFEGMIRRLEELLLSREAPICSGSTSPQIVQTPVHYVYPTEYHTKVYTFTVYHLLLYMSLYRGTWPFANENNKALGQ